MSRIVGEGPVAAGASLGGLPRGLSRRHAAAWLAVALASACGGSASTLPGRDPPRSTETRRASYHPLTEAWWSGSPIAWPQLAPRPTFVPLENRGPRRWERSREVGVVGGAVQFETSLHPGGWRLALRWRGLETDGAPFEVDGLEVPFLPADAPTSIILSPHDPVEDGRIVLAGRRWALAVTPRFAVLLDERRAGAAPEEEEALVVITAEGSSRRLELPSRGPPSRAVPIPLPDGGLGLMLEWSDARLLVQLAADGGIVQHRVRRGPGLRHHQLLAWRAGTVGELEVGVGGRRAVFHAVDGATRELRLAAAPSAPCVSSSTPELRVAWSTGGPGAPRGSWWLADQSGGEVCVRAGSRPGSDLWRRRGGGRFLFADSGRLGGWAVEMAGVVPLEVVEPTSETRSSRILSMARVEDRIWLALSASGPNLGLWLWSAGPDGEVREVPAPRDLPLWAQVRVRVRPGPILVSRRGVVSEIEGASARVVNGDVEDAIQLGAHPVALMSRGGAFGLFPLGSAELDSAGPWVPIHSRLPSYLVPSSEGPVVLGFELPSSAVVHRRRGRSWATSRTRLSHDVVGYAPLAVAADGEEIILAGALRSPYRLVFARIEGHRAARAAPPIPLRRCASGVRALSASPVRVAWADCAIGSADIYLRVAELRGGRWVSAGSPLRLGRPLRHGPIAAEFDDSSLWVLRDDGATPVLHRLVEGAWTRRDLGARTPRAPEPIVMAPTSG